MVLCYGSPKKLHSNPDSFLTVLSPFLAAREGIDEDFLGKEKDGIEGASCQVERGWRALQESWERAELVYRDREEEKERKERRENKKGEKNQDHLTSLPSLTSELNFRGRNAVETPPLQVSLLMSLEICKPLRQVLSCS